MKPSTLIVRPGIIVLICLAALAPSSEARHPAAVPTRTPPARPPSLTLARDLGPSLARGKPKEQKLDQRLALLQQEYPSLSQAATVGVRLLDGRVQVRVACNPQTSAGVCQVVEANGGDVTGMSPTGDLLQAWVPPHALSDLVADERILRVDLPADAISLEAPQAETYTSEGLAAMGAASWHGAGYQGSGVKVGLIEAGFLGYEDLLGSELPATVSVRNLVDGEGLTDIEGTTTRGTACAEVVHDVAPDAALYLARVQTDIDLFEAVDWLIESGVDVISTSLGWLNVTPGDGTGYLADLVASARDAGVLWVTSAGDLRLNHWGGPFSDADGDGWYNLEPEVEIGDYLGTIPSGVLLEAYVRWDDWTDVTNDFDLYLVRYDAPSTTWEEIASSENVQDGSPGQTPTEEVHAYTTGEATYYGFAIRRYDASRAVNFEVFAGPYFLYSPVAERSLPNLADAPAAVSVSAADAASPYSQELYSSEGPTNGPGGTANGGLTKPDIAAYDNVSTYTHASQVPPGTFVGAGAAASHVAGAAALVLSADPDETPAQVQALLEGWAVDVGASGVDTVYGYGRLYLGTPPPRPTATSTPSGAPTSTHTPTRTPTATRTPTRTPTATPRPERHVQLPLALRDCYLGPYRANDPYYLYQWGLTRIGAQGAWPLGRGTGIVVAVVDTGVDMDHPDLAAKLVGGYDVANDDASPQDDQGHGTHVAGIAAAITGNRLGVAGVGWDASIMPVKVLNADGSAASSDVAEGIVGAVETGARVINLSLGSEYPSDIVEAATDYAHSKGVLVVASAGNCGDPNTYAVNGCSRVNPVIYPAANPHVLAVGATTPFDTRASYSEYGGFVDVAAPGDDILSTIWNDSYDYLSGTSMASPFVAGLASLVWGCNPALSNDQVAQIIAGTAEDLGAAGRDDRFGWGLVDAQAAVTAACSGNTMVVAGLADEPGEALAPEARASWAGEGCAPIRPGIVLVRPGIPAGAEDLPRVLGLAGATLESELPALGYVRVRVPEGQERDIAARLMAEGTFAFAEPDYLLTLW